MKSAVYNEFGKPADVLEIQDTPTPEPKADEVRLKVILSAIHNHDLITVQGQYGNKPDLPAVGGSEAVGTIDALGDNVQGFKQGQRVVVSGVQGTWAQYFIAPAKKVVPIPDAIDDELAAQLLAMPLSALMLIEFLEMQPNQWMAHNAANGAVGEALAQFAAKRGINTVNIVRSEDSKQELIDLGITKNIIVTGKADDKDSDKNSDKGNKNDSWKDKVKDLVGDASIKGAVDAVGGSAGGDLLSLLGQDGTMASLGGMSGKPLTLNPQDLIFKHTQVKGFWGARLMQEASQETMKRLIGEVIERAANGDLKLPTGGVYDLADIKKAVSNEVQSDKVGKILIKP